MYFIKEIFWLSNTNITLRELNRCNKKVKGYQIRDDILGRRGIEPNTGLNPI